MKQSDASKLVKLAKDKLLGFRHLASLDDNDDLASQADEFFTKRPGEGPGGDKAGEPKALKPRPGSELHAQTESSDDKH